MTTEARQHLEQRVDQYITSLFSQEDEPLLTSVEKLKEYGLPAIHVTANEGRLLYILARMVRPTRILEIGTLTGYSTIWIARALAPGGRLITIDNNPRCIAAATASIAAAGLAHLVEIREGDAVTLLQEMADRREGPFDLCFIDAEKTQYSAYLDRVLPLCRSGTVILSDNLIRNGSVLGPDPAKPDAPALAAYNQKLATDPRLESLILPLINREVLDGLGISIVR